MARKPSAVKKKKGEESPLSFRVQIFIFFLIYHNRWLCTHSLSPKCECGKCQAEVHAETTLPFRESSASLTQHPPATPYSMTRDKVEKGFLPHVFGPGWGWDSPLHLSREPRCPQNRVCQESASPDAPCGYSLAPQSKGEKTRQTPSDSYPNACQVSS